MFHTISVAPSLMASLGHKPLVAIFWDRDLEKITNPHLKEVLWPRSSMYRFRINHTPRKKYFGPDATSHYPAPNYTRSQEKDSDISIGMKSSIAASYKSGQQLQAVTWDRIVTAATSDPECMKLIKTIHKDFPRSK